METLKLRASKTVAPLALRQSPSTLLGVLAQASNKPTLIRADSVASRLSIAKEISSSLLQEQLPVNDRQWTGSCGWPQCLLQIVTHIGFRIVYHTVSHTVSHKVYLTASLTQRLVQCLTLS